jgi:ribosomal protein S8
MVGNSNKLSKWDEAWLSDKDEEKYEYAIEYIRTRWPLEVAQNIPPNWSGCKQNSVRDLFLRLLQESQFDTRGIIRRTKEAWRSYYKNSLKRSSGNYTNVKLTSADKNKMRVLAEETGLSSVSDVVSSILNNEHKELLANKKLERYMAAKNKAAMKDKTTLSGFVTNFKLKKINEEKHKLQQELEFAQQKLATLTDLFSQQLITLERYESDGIAPLTDDESKQAKEMAQGMMESFEEQKAQSAIEN